MIRSSILALFLLCFVKHKVRALSSTIVKRIFVDVTADFQCTFDLIYTETEVTLSESTVTCSPEEPTDVTNIEVELSAPNGFEFSGLININPSEIVLMVIDNAVNAPEEEPEIDQEEIELKEVFNNVTAEEGPDDEYYCGIDPVMETMEEDLRRNRSYTSIPPVKFWDNAVIPWSFVSTGDGFAKYGVYTNANIGLPEEEVRTVMLAMKQIEASTCIKFNFVKPRRGQKWLLISRDSRHADLTCMIPYIKSNLVGKNVADLGDLFKKAKWTHDCFPGAYAYYGEDSPQNFVISKTRLSTKDQGKIGLVVHELLHNLGLGHTQKRQDATQHIYVYWANINTQGQAQYKQCLAREDKTCDHANYNDYNTPYDCMSIMHYRDTFFITPAAQRAGQKTMRGRRAGCDLSSRNSRLTAADKEVLRKVYCAHRPQQKVVQSPNYPNNYPDNKDETYTVSVRRGKRIQLWFTDFKIEAEAKCAYDWVQVVDADGTVLMDKACGMTKPKQVISKTNKLYVKFHSDAHSNFAGFRAEYKEIASAPTPVEGAWGQWTGFSKCGNGKDGKSTCRKRKVRYCNKPAPAGGGRQCPGNSEFVEDCVPAWTDPAKNPLCVLNGGWTTWSSPSKCSSDCRGTKTRKCTNPIPINGKDCEGAPSETSSCTGGDCASTSDGIIQSTNYPEKYPDKDDLSFPLEVPSGSTIELTFQDFSVESHAKCDYDYVKVVDSDGKTELGKLCGDATPSTMRSSGNKMTVIFHSDENVNKKGFKATWKAVSGTV